MDLRYPIGPFAPKETYSASDNAASIARIEALPANLEIAIKSLTDAQLDTPYRDGGWTVRQVVHHMADSHMNAFIRLKWTITEPTPLIKAYNEKDWAETPDTKLDVGLSVALIRALHAKWSAFLKTLTAEQVSREFLHPETKKLVRIDRQMALYAWHGEHHLAHITELKKRNGWK